MTGLEYYNTSACIDIIWKAYSLTIGHCTIRTTFDSYLPVYSHKWAVCVRVRAPSQRSSVGHSHTRTILLLYVIDNAQYR